MAYTAKDPCPPPWCFLYLTETKSWKWEKGGGDGEEEEGGEKVSLKTHATARGVGKKTCYPTFFHSNSTLSCTVLRPPAKIGCDLTTKHYAKHHCHILVTVVGGNNIRR